MAQILTAQPEQYYFGKYPARGDFVRSAGGGPLLNVFDQWISSALDMLAPDPRWKLDYDATAPMRFAFVGTSSCTVVAGVVTPSMDSSARRFPFVLATRFDVTQPIDFIALAPLRLARYWQGAELIGLQARQSAEHPDFVGGIALAPTGLIREADGDERQFGAFMQGHTIGALEAEVRAIYPAFSLRQSVLALGMLLQPVLAHGAANLNKGLLLPLPPRADASAYTATYWLSLLSGFLERHDFEISILIARRRKQPVLLIGFAGASADALVAMISADADQGDYLVDLADAAWVEDYADGDAGLRKLSAYAANAQLSLTQLHVTFNEVFLGL
jgi:type VI secretion system protein ImpM